MQNVHCVLIDIPRINNCRNMESVCKEIITAYPNTTLFIGKFFIDAEVIHTEVALVAL